MNFKEEIGIYLFDSLYSFNKLQASQLVQILVEILQTKTVISRKRIMQMNLFFIELFVKTETELHQTWFYMIMNNEDRYQGQNGGIWNVVLTEVPKISWTIYTSNGNDNLFKIWNLNTIQSRRLSVTHNWWDFCYRIFHWSSVKLNKIEKINCNSSPICDNS